MKVNEKKFSKFLNIIFAFLLLSCVNANKRKLVIDHDGGTDDVIAVFIALLFEKYFNGPNVVALTTVVGNTDKEYGYYNSQRVLEIAGRQDIPIYLGAEKSTVISVPNTLHFFGKDGLGDVAENFTNLVPAKNKHAVNALIELSKKHEGRLTVVTVGPDTNIALAMSMDPDFLSRLEHLYIGAGHIYSDAFPNPEFNVQNDVEAYYTIAENATPDKVTILPYSQDQLFLNTTWDWREDVLGTIDSDIIRAINRYEAYIFRKIPSWSFLDPALVSQVLDPSIVTEYRYYNNSIILCGDYRGINTNTHVTKAEANVRMIYSSDEDRYKQFLYKVFSADAKPIKSGVSTTQTQKHN